MVRIRHAMACIRWTDPAPISLAVLAFAVVCTARLMADGVRTTLPVALASGIVFACCCYVVGLVLCTWWDFAAAKPAHGLASRIGSWLAAGRRTSMQTSIRQRLVIYWLVLLVCWAPWFAVSWPGVMRDDTIAQFMQSAGYHRFFTQHPLFDTLVFGLFWQFGKLLGNLVWGLVLYTLVQALLMSANLALVLCYLRARGVPRLAVGFGLVYGATFYAVAGSAATMSKDSLSAVFMVPLALIVTEICLTAGTALNRPWVCVALVTLMTLAMISKRTVLVILLCAFVAVVWACRKARMRAVICMVVAVVLAQAVWTPVVNRLTGAHESVDRDVFGFIMLPVARIESENPRLITAKEREDLSPVMDLEKAGRQYNDKRSDETSWTMHITATGAQKLKALRAWAQIGARHPQDYVKAYATLDYDWYYPSHGIAFPADSRYLFEPRYMRQWNTFVTPPVTAEYALRDFRTSPRPYWKDSVIDIRNRALAFPVFSYAVYLTYLPALMAFYFISRRRWRHLAAWSLFGFAVLSLYASPIVLCWFAVPVFHMLPLVVGLGFIAVPDGQMPSERDDRTSRPTRFPRRPDRL